mmetsp:Transcript_1682/g.3362  ORF Transcript_1682/g.3362 Transcript_1682/m.3362 type:complete len:240 (-) Transcript_1682:16-735(-)
MSPTVPIGYRPNNKPLPSSSTPRSADPPPPPPRRTGVSIPPRRVGATNDHSLRPSYSRPRRRRTTKRFPTVQTHCYPRHKHPPRSWNTANDWSRRRSTRRCDAPAVLGRARGGDGGSRPPCRAVRPSRVRRSRAVRTGWRRACGGRRRRRRRRGSRPRPSFAVWKWSPIVGNRRHRRHCRCHCRGRTRRTNRDAVPPERTFPPSWVCNSSSPSSSHHRRRMIIYRRSSLLRVLPCPPGS